MRHLFAISAISMVSACSQKHAPTMVTQAPVTPAAVAQPKQSEPSPLPVSPHVAVSADLGRQCSLPLADRKEAPEFGFDASDLLPQDRTVLEQVATCLTNGPLKGRRLHLIGRADPRGTDEYNLGLGDRRARTVSDYLVRLGVGTGQITLATRGAIDASGRDEPGWQLDRRVDLQLN